MMIVVCWVLLLISILVHVTFLMFTYHINVMIIMMSFLEYICKLSALIDEVSTSNLILLGDFNAAVNTRFVSELVDLCTRYSLIISDYITYGQDSGQFTYVSDAHHSTFWLDHIVCSHDIYSKLTLITIHDELPSSDHLPIICLY